MMDMNGNIDQGGCLDMGKYRYIDGVPYIRITSMLNTMCNPGDGFFSWLKDKGHFSTFEANEASKKGTLLHKLMETYIKTGKAITKGLDHKEYLKFTGFQQWCEKYSPEVIATEKVVCDGQCSGKADLVCKINGVETVVDYKTGSGIYDSHYAQICFYAKCLECDPAILHLKSGPKVQHNYIDSIPEVWFDIYEWYYLIWKHNPTINKKPPKEYDIPDMVVRKETV